MALLISDSLTLDGKVPARRPWPAVAFRYRPALPEDVYAYLAEVRGADGKKHLRAVVSLLHRQLVSWDVVNDKDEPVAITPEVLKKVPHRVLDVLVDHVTGYGPEEAEGDAKN